MHVSAVKAAGFTHSAFLTLKLTTVPSLLELMFFFLFGTRLTYKLLSNRQLFHIIISENTNIAIMSNLIQMEKVIQVQLDREGEQFVEIPGEPPNILQPIHGHR